MRSRQGNLWIPRLNTAQHDVRCLRVRDVFLLGESSRCAELLLVERAITDYGYGNVIVLPDRPRMRVHDL
jgi:hypothetical protein